MKIKLTLITASGRTDVSEPATLQSAYRKIEGFIFGAIGTHAFIDHDNENGIMAGIHWSIKRIEQ